MSRDALLVVGLGNPGAVYAGTRHNVGFAVIEAVRDALPGSVDSIPCRGGILERVDVFPDDGGPRFPVLMLRPQLYMNRSGAPVAEVAERFAIDPTRVLAVFDDLDLPLGRLRMRRGGGHGGHNGVRDLIAFLRPAEEPSLAGEAPADFPRLRLGIGRPPEGVETEDYVLGGFSEDERPAASAMVAAAVEAVTAWIEDGIEKALEVANAGDVGKVDQHE